MSVGTTYSYTYLSRVVVRSLIFFACTLHQVRHVRVNTSMGPSVHASSSHPSISRSERIHTEQTYNL